MDGLHCKHCKARTENDEVRLEKCGKIYFLKALCAVCGAKKAVRAKPPKEEKAEPEEAPITSETQ